jgi:hypothetical protein
VLLTAYGSRSALLVPALRCAPRRATYERSLARCWSSSLRFVLHAQLPAWFGRVGSLRSACGESQSQRLKVKVNGASGGHRLQTDPGCVVGLRFVLLVGWVRLGPVRRALFERTRNLTGVQAADGFRGWWGCVAPLAPPSEPWFGGPARQGQTPTSSPPCELRSTHYPAAHRPGENPPHTPTTPPPTRSTNPRSREFPDDGSMRGNRPDLPLVDQLSVLTLQWFAGEVKFNLDDASPGPVRKRRGLRR